MIEIVCISFIFGLAAGLLIAFIVWRHLRGQIDELRGLLKTSVGDLVKRAGQ